MVFLTHQQNNLLGWLNVSYDAWTQSISALVGALIAALISILIINIQRHYQKKDEKKEIAEKFLVSFDSFSYYFLKLYNGFNKNNLTFKAKYQKREHYEGLLYLGRYCLENLENINSSNFKYEQHRHYLLIIDEINHLIHEITNYFTEIETKSTQKIGNTIKEKLIVMNLSYETLSNEADKQKKVLGLDNN